MRNDDGSYHISNWCNLGLAPIERFLQVIDSGPVLKETKSKCRLYRDKDDTEAYVYVIVIDLKWPSTHQMPSSSIALSDSKSDSDVVVYDPSATGEADKIVCSLNSHPSILILIPYIRCRPSH